MVLKLLSPPGPPPTLPPSGPLFLPASEIGNQVCDWTHIPYTSRASTSMASEGESPVCNQSSCLWSMEQSPQRLEARQVTRFTATEVVGQLPHLPLRLKAWHMIRFSTYEEGVSNALACLRGLKPRMQQDTQPLEWWGSPCLPQRMKAQNMTGLPASEAAGQPPHLASEGETTIWCATSLIASGVAESPHLPQRLNIWCTQVSQTLDCGGDHLACLRDWKSSL